MSEIVANSSSNLQYIKRSEMRGIIVIDTSYTLKMYLDRQLEQALKSRELSGYFSRVISVHPFGGLLDTGDEQFGKPVFTRLSDSHVFVEGKIGFSKRLRFLPPINFLFAQLELAYFILRMAWKIKVDVIRIGDPYYLGILGLMLASLLKVPLAIRVGGRYDDIVRASGRPIMPRLFMYRWIEKVVERYVFPRCDLIAGANEDNLNYAFENGGRPEVATIFRYGNLIHPYHWIDPAGRPAADQILDQLSLSNQTFALTVARLEPGKFVEHTLLIVAELIRRGHNIKLLLVGNGQLRNDLENLAYELKIMNSVIFSGYQNQEWLASVLPRASLILSPQMGRALVEVALAGRPIAAYDYDWQREIIVDGETGFLVPHKDWMGLSDKAEYILLHPEVSKKLGDNVRNKVFQMMNPVQLEKVEQIEYSKMFARFPR